MTIMTTTLTSIRTEATNFIIQDFVTLVIGTSSTTPTPADSALGAQVFSATRDGYTNNTPGIVVVSGTVPAGSANGNTLREVGWKNADTTLRERNLVNAIVKTSDINLFLDLTLTVTVTEV